MVRYKYMKVMACETFCRGQCTYKCFVYLPRKAADGRGDQGQPIDILCIYSSEVKISSSTTRNGTNRTDLSGGGMHLEGSQTIDLSGKYSRPLRATQMFTQIPKSRARVVKVPGKVKRAGHCLSILHTSEQVGSGLSRFGVELNSP